jgi:hypothetical protein
MSVSGDAFASPPAGPARVIISVFIISWLLWQLAVPLSYYLGGDPEEERFTWRMFSGVWLLHKNCSVSVTEFRSQPGGGTRPVGQINLNRTLHREWVYQLTKNRRSVVEKFLRTRCQGDPSLAALEFVRACPVAPPGRIPAVDLRFDCGTGAFTTP